MKTEINGIIKRTDKKKFSQISQQAHKADMSTEIKQRKKSKPKGTAVCFEEDQPTKEKVSYDNSNNNNDLFWIEFEMQKKYVNYFPNQNMVNVIESLKKSLRKHR